jgi:hypothetical protein
LLVNSKVSTIYAHKAVVQTATVLPTFKINLQKRVDVMMGETIGDDDSMDEKKHII